MSFGESIRIARQKAFYNQEDFARKLNVAPSTVNRWELDKVRPNIKAMKAIKLFCEENTISYGETETEWLYHSLKSDALSACAVPVLKRESLSETEHKSPGIRTEMRS